MYEPDFFPGFLFITAKVVSKTAMIFFLSNVASRYVEMLRTFGRPLI